MFLVAGYAWPVFLFFSSQQQIQLVMTNNVASMSIVNCPVKVG